MSPRSEICLIMPFPQEMIEIAFTLAAWWKCLLASQNVQGVVTELLDQPEVAETKPIFALLDEFPVLTENQLKLALSFQKNIFSRFLDSFQPCFPPGLQPAVGYTFQTESPGRF